MADIGTSIFGGGGKQTTDNTIDPQSEELNKIRLQQLSGLFNQTSYGSFAEPRPDIYTGSPAVDSLFSQANTPVNKSQSAGPTDLSNLMSLGSYINLGLDEGSNYINQVARPEIMQSASLQGLEYGGAVSEAIAKATAGIALPFLQGLPAASSALTLAGPQASQLGAQTALTGAQLQQTDAQSALLGANRASALFPLADYNRALGEQDLLRQQGVVTTGLTGLPFTPVTDTTAKKSSQPLFNFFGQG